MSVLGLKYTGGVPYIILKPVLETASSKQLVVIEHHNPYLVGESDELWQFHCQREHKSQRPLHLETWRDMYIRCSYEKEAKLKALSANIKLSRANSVPVRQTKLVSRDNVVKLPRNIVRKQLRDGICKQPSRPSSNRWDALSAMKKPTVTPSMRLEALAKPKTQVPAPVKPLVAPSSRLATSAASKMRSCAPTKASITSSVSLKGLAKAESQPILPERPLVAASSMLTISPALDVQPAALKATSMRPPMRSELLAKSAGQAAVPKPVRAPSSGMYLENITFRQ